MSSIGYPLMKQFINIFGSSDISSDAAISKHLKNIFEEGELVADSVISKMKTTAADGKNYTTTYYSLDAIIAVKTGEQVPVSLLTQKIVFQNCNIVT